MTFTTASITLSWRKRLKVVRLFPFRSGITRVYGGLHWLLALALFAVAMSPLVAHAEGATITDAKLEATEDGYQIEADLQLQLTATLQEAVRKGVPLYFVVEFELSRGRWYWFDQTVMSASRERRVSYAPLTDQYRISFSGISQNVTSFEEVRRALSRVRSWTVLEKGKLRAGEKYDAALRFRLDTSQLPKPFQLNAIASKEWSLASDWYRWVVTVPAGNKP
jgi:hypothetical protein